MKTYNVPKIVTLTEQDIKMSVKLGTVFVLRSVVG